MSRAFAKSLRANMTDAERRLWYRLRAHRLEGIKFKRQVPIGKYVADFACMERKLLVEVDGSQHAERASDVERTKWLEDQGFRILRFWNNEVLNETNAVLEIILATVIAVSPSPGAPGGAPPSPRRGEGKEE
ncbi:endonuclease domain-containing protein [Rhodopseudomonas sp. RCAM05734]|uniref:endonuclease domain-containing protein n=1 Tax=Rhodopseudomonas sp. RCAM05734 TaxID=3457549 RepID=UPI004044D72A